MPVLESRIIERGSHEVNGRARLLALLLALAICAGCSRESRAQRLLEEARTEVQRGHLEQAVTVLERVTNEYGGTDAARRAQKDIILYRGLMEAERLDPLRRVRDQMVQTARKLERSKTTSGTWPDTLADAPKDPWGQPLVYERTPNGYRLASWGADGTPGGEPDLVIVNGRFTEDPLGGNP